MKTTTGSASSRALEHFQTWLYSKNMSDNTICVYRCAVEQFYTLYPQLTQKNMQLYKIHLLENYKPQTVNLRIRALNCFAEYRQASVSPIPMIKIQQKTYLDKIISQADYEYLKRRLLEEEEYTYYYIVRLIAATGVRVSELVTFQVVDVYRGHKDIYSKGNKMRRVYIPTCLQRELLSWLSSLGRSSGFLFLNRFQAPVSPSGIRCQLKNFAYRFHLDPEIMYPHSFRHRFAKNFLAKFNDISLLADLMGHESIETTRIYLTRSSDEQRALIDKVVTW